MKTKLYVIALLPLLIFSIPVYSAEPVNSASSLKDCPQDAAMKQFACLQERFPKIEAEMQDILKEADKRISNEYGEELTQKDRTTLKLAQQGWIQYRDNQCRYKSPNKMGEAPSRSFKVQSCLNTKTEARIKELKQTYLHLEQ